MKYLFLSGSRSSGNEFVHSLLDGHPQILAVPFPVMFHYFWQRYGNVAAQGAEALFDALCRHSGLAFILEGYKNSEGGYLEKDSRKLDELNVDLAVFRKVFSGELSDKITRKSTFLAFYKGYAASIGREWAGLEVILENEHNTFWHNDILEDFPDARFISSIRDPRAIFASCRKGRFGLVYEDMPETSMLMHLYQTFINQSVYASLLGKSSYYLIKNERIHQDREAEVYNLADWLGIKKDPQLLKSTFANSPWSGNSAYKTEVKNSGEPAPVNRSPKWRQELSGVERDLVEILFEDYIKLYGYDKEWPISEKNFFKKIRAFLAPVKNQMNPQRFNLPTSKQETLKSLEYVLFPFLRVALKLVYDRLLKVFSTAKAPGQLYPSQKLLPKLRVIFSGKLKKLC